MAVNSDTWSHGSWMYNGVTSGVLHSSLESIVRSHVSGLPSLLMSRETSEYVARNEGEKLVKNFSRKTSSKEEMKDQDSDGIIILRLFT